MDDVFRNAVWLIGAIRKGLEARGGEGVDEVLRRLAEHRLEPADFRLPEPTRLPVLKYLPDCIGQAMLLDADLAAALAAIEDDLHWAPVGVLQRCRPGRGLLRQLRLGRTDRIRRLL